MRKRSFRAALFAAALATPFCATAVSLNTDGLGQALIYPYYTVNSAAGNPYNTYLSVVNHSADAKALRVRFREARLSREVLSFNLFLAPNDVWTGAVVPFAGGARLISRDESCSDPGFADFAVSPVPFVDFSDAAYIGANSDGAGAGMERTREGFVEVLEMATLTGASASAVGRAGDGFPPTCMGLRGPIPASTIAAPTGGISGTLTLINVASGQDFTVSAEALADLASRPYFRVATDPYPDFAAAEIDPMSLVVANGKAYRSVWSRPVEAVSAVMMRDRWIFEYSLDAATASLTDVVLTLPTRQFHAGATAASPPFSRPATWTANCLAGAPLIRGESMGFTYYSRETQTRPAQPGFPGIPSSPSPAVCAAAAVASVTNLAAHMPAGAGPTGVLGSIAKGLGFDDLSLLDQGSFQHGWLYLSPTTSVPVTSLPTSTRTDLATGQQTAGAHQFSGLPVVGMWLRTMKNGNLTCAASICQGNYGNAYSMRYRVGVSP